MVRQPAVLAQLFDRFVKGCGGRLRSASRCREGRCREAGLAWTFPLHRTSVRYSEAVGFSRLRSTRVRLIKRPVGGDVDALPLNRTRTVPPGSAKYAVIAESPTARPVQASTRSPNTGQISSSVVTGQVSSSTGSARNQGNQIDMGISELHVGIREISSHTRRLP
jgi:hypothetical protein